MDSYNSMTGHDNAHTGGDSSGTAVACTTSGHHAAMQTSNTKRKRAPPTKGNQPRAGRSWEEWEVRDVF